MSNATIVALILIGIGAFSPVRALVLIGLFVLLYAATT